MRDRRSRRLQADSGFTLIEVIVAFVLIAIMATAALAFSIRANTTSSYIQHRQVAVTVAGQAMDVVAATPAVNNGLVTGRCQTDVQSSFTTNSSIAGVSNTYPFWGTTNCASTPAVPLTTSTNLAGTTYSTTTLIGTCYRPLLAASGTDCGKATGYSTTPPSDTAAASLGLVDETRAIVVVRWDADDECPSGCSYTSATLVDTNSDLQWVG